VDWQQAPPISTTSSKAPSAQRPFACGTCGLGFKRREHATRHHSTKHTGLRPWSCGNCAKSFDRKDNLTAHVRACH
jgi:uncharacterized Zn-finger protein